MNNSSFDGKYPIVELLFVGGVGDEVTGSSTVLKIVTKDGKVQYGMVDCGAVQGADEQLNYEYPIKGNMISFVLLTHAHFDHIGSLPILYKQGFRGRIYCSSVVKSVANPLLTDAANINLKKAGYDSVTMKSLRRAEKKIRYERHTDTFHKDKRNIDSVLSQIEDASTSVLYSKEDVDETLKLFTNVEMYQYVEVAEGIFAKFIPTTHQNGACKIELYVMDSDDSFNMVFSGDIGSSEALLYKNHTEEPNESVDCLVLESLHGTEEPVETLRQSINKLAHILNDAVKHNKNVVLAGFSLDRNAGLIYLLNEFRRAGMFIDVVVDSPLTMTQLSVYQNSYNKDNSKWFRKLGDNPFDTSKFRVINSGRDHIESTLHGEGSRVIVTASANGMGGRIVNYFENCIQRDDYVFVFCGWIVPDSPSYRLHEAGRGTIVEVNDGEHYIKRCETIRLHGFSSHGYFPEMLSHVNIYPNCSTLILNHAREEDKNNVKERISKFYGGNILIPCRFDAYELVKGNARKLTFRESIFEFEQVLVSKVCVEEFKSDEAN